MILDKISQLCVARGMNLSKLERETKLSNATIRRWEKSSPSADNLKRVADLFGVSVDYLLGREGYDMSDGARACASQFDALSPDKQQLVSAYISIIRAQ